MPDSDQNSISTSNSNTDGNGDSSEPKGVDIKFCKMELKISGNQTPYFILVAASILLLISVFGHSKNKGYGIAVAVVSIVLGMNAILFSYRMKVIWKKIDIYFAYFLLVWNLVGAIILTFNGPFYTTENGYFAIWAMVVFSLLATKLQYKKVTEKLKNSGAVVGLLFSAIVLMIAIISIAFYDWRNIYGLIVSILTTAVTPVLIYVDHKGEGQKIKQPLMVIFSGMWFLAVILLTFANGMFRQTGNGYFATWAGFIFSVYATCTC